MLFIRTQTMLPKNKQELDNQFPNEICIIHFSSSNGQNFSIYSKQLIMKKLKNSKILNKLHITILINQKDPLTDSMNNVSIYLDHLSTIMVTTAINNLPKIWIN